MRHILHTFFCFSLIIICSCGNDEPTPVKKTPSLSPTSLSLVVGDNATVTVENLDEFTIFYDKDIISTTVDGNKILVEALSEGETELIVSGDKVRLSCKITVISPSELEYDFSPELADPTERYVSRTLTLSYANNGIMFANAPDGTIKIIDITTGNNVVFNEASRTLEENGTAIPIETVTTEKTEGAKRWLHIVDTNGYHIVLVIG